MRAFQHRCAFRVATASSSTSRLTTSRSRAAAVSGTQRSYCRLPVVDVPFPAMPCSAVGESMLGHLRTTGYFGVRCPAVNQTLMNAAFEESRSFFALPLEARKPLAWRDPIANRGYYHVHTPSVGGDGDRELDSVAVHVMAREVPHPETLRSAWLEQSEHPSLVLRSREELLAAAAAPNQWPVEAEAPHFRRTFEAYHEACTAVGEAVLTSLALAAGLAPERLLALHSHRDHTVELKQFPALAVPVPGSPAGAYFAALQRAEQDKLREQSADASLSMPRDSDSELLAQSSSRATAGSRVGAHTDFCSLTLLALPCDDVGGLQERSVDGSYHHVTRTDDVLLVHIGDMLEALLAGAVVGTKHRVVSPTSMRAWRDPRYTMQFFMSPDREAHIAPMLAVPETRASVPLLLRSKRPQKGALCGDLVIERHDAILASRMQLF